MTSTLQGQLAARPAAHRSQRFKDVVCWKALRKLSGTASDSEASQSHMKPEFRPTADLDFVTRQQELRRKKLASFREKVWPRPTDKKRFAAEDGGNCRVFLRGHRSAVEQPRLGTFLGTPCTLKGPVMGPARTDTLHKQKPRMQRAANASVMLISLGVLDYR